MAGSQREYSAIFSIGAKLMGSFKGVMAAAQARLQALHHTAAKTGEGVLKLFERFGVGLSLFAGFAAGKIFQSIFEGAGEEAIAADQRMRKLSILLLQHNEIRKKGLGFAQRQATLIFEANAGLAAQGVIGQELLDTAAAQLSVYGYSPKKIAGMMGPLADVLATSIGINATQENAASLANAWGRAVKTGMVKPMKEFGFVLDKPGLKDFAKLSKSGRNNFLLAWARGFRGSNIAAASTAIGKIQKFHNEMMELSKDIGNELLPAQAEMAEAWRKALPAAKPAIIGTLKRVGNLAAWAGQQMKDFFNVLTPPQEAPKVAPDLFTAYSNMIPQLGRFNAVLGRSQQSFDATNDAANDYTRSGLYQLLDSLGKVHESLQGLSPLMEKNKADTSSWGKYLGKVFDDLTKSAANGDGHYWFAPSLKSTAKDIENLGKVWQGIKDGWDVGKIAAVIAFGAIGAAINDSILAPIRAIQGAWKSAVDFIKTYNPLTVAPDAIMRGMAGLPSAPAPSRNAQMRAITGLPPPPSAAAAANIPGMATGGIIRGHSLLQVAERGPEAIIPLSGGPRAEGLLNYASRAIGMGGITNNRGGDVHVNFSPQVSIGSGSGDQERRVESKLKEMVAEFMVVLNAATRQERRLSFDGMPS